MKQPNSLIPHLFSNSNKLQEQQCFEKLRKLLPKRFQDTLIYIYKKGDTLYFVFNHQGIVMEFNYIKKDINALLNMIRTHQSLCQDIHFRTIKSYAKFFPKREPKIKPIQQYQERAKGIFEIKIENPELQKILAEIQKKIQEHARTR